MSQKSTLNDTGFLDFESISDLKATISVYQNFEIKRIFIVSVEKPTVRGNHAHRKCCQLILVKFGKIMFDLSDGFESKQIILTPASGIFYIPPGIWAVQRYLEKSEMVVMCDNAFDEKDYMRDWGVFINYKSGQK
jgi:dTDP-4-dehydrorhamnose 3,5-epimerase-like enzyme